MILNAVAIQSVGSSTPAHAPTLSDVYSIIHSGGAWCILLAHAPLNAFDRGGKDRVIAKYGSKAAGCITALSDAGVRHSRQFNNEPPTINP